jgi:hypothetical protein
MYEVAGASSLRYLDSTKMVGYTSGGLSVSHK